MTAPALSYFAKVSDQRVCT